MQATHLLHLCTRQPAPDSLCVPAGHPSCLPICAPGSGAEGDLLSGTQVQGVLGAGPGTRDQLGRGRGGVCRIFDGKMDVDVDEDGAGMFNNNIIIEGLSLLQSIPLTTANKQPQA